MRGALHFISMQVARASRQRQIARCSDSPAFARYRHATQQDTLVEKRDATWRSFFSPGKRLVHFISVVDMSFTNKFADVTGQAGDQFVSNACRDDDRQPTVDA